MVFSKPLEEITQEDLERLVGVTESHELEFKQEPFPRGDEGTREMLRDTASFANASGGYIVIGMETDAEERAVRLRGLESAEDEVRRITDSCLANIDERVLGLRARAIPLREGGHTIIVFIPRSTTAPHMVTFRGINQFWKRYGTLKNKMSVEEIKEAAQKTVSLRKTLEEFLEERKTRILRKIGNDPYLLIMATPLIVKDEFLNIFDPSIRDLVHNPPYTRASGWNIGRAHLEIQPSLYGILAVEGRGKGIQLEIFRNAHVELRIPISLSSFCRKTFRHEGAERPVIYAYALCEYPVSFLYFVEKLYSQNGVLEPIVIQLSLYNIGGIGLAERVSFDDVYSPNFWQEPHLELPAMQFPMPLQPENTAQTLADRVWNAFGFDGAPLFRDGRFTP